MRLRYWFINYPYCRLRRAGGRGCVNCALRLWCPLPNQPPSAAVFLKQVTGIRCTLELLKNQLSFDWHRRCVASGWTVYDQKKKKKSPNTWCYHIVFQCSYLTHPIPRWTVAVAHQADESVSQWRSPRHFGKLPFSHPSLSVGIADWWLPLSGWGRLLRQKP